MAVRTLSRLRGRAGVGALSGYSGNEVSHWRKHSDYISDSVLVEAAPTPTLPRKRERGVPSN
jgi:hypothetical protein